VGGVVGIGIFLVPVVMARSLGATGWVFAMWIATGGMAASGALCYAELATRFPLAGGPYVYLRVAFGSTVAFLYGWQCLLVMDPGITAALAFGAARHAGDLIGLSPLAAKAAAIAIIVALATLTALGTRLAANLLIGLTLLKVGALLALVIGGFATGAADPARLHPWFERAAGAPALAAGLAGGFLSAFFSFGGWWELSKVANEVSRPERNLPIAFLSGVAIVTALYLLASSVFLAVLTPAEAISTQLSAVLLGERVLGATGGRLLAAAVVVSAIGSVAALMLSSPRLYVAMAQDGVFPRAIAAPHSRLGTPAGAIAVQAALASLLVAAGSFDDIVAYFVFTTVAFITLSVVSIFVLPAGTTRFDARGLKLAAATFIAISVVLLVLVAIGRPLATALGAAMVALGVPVHAAHRRLGKRARSALL
jgi:APA family basic amino acid/polyamine antiporter